MTTLDPQTLLTLAVTAAIGYVMVAAGLGKNALELRRRRRVCPACGRDAAACRCS